MPLDAVCLTALVKELKDVLAGAKIDKVQQPERDEIILSLRSGGRNERLIISAGTGDARMCLTKMSFENPAQPPMFCMLLRKHLVGGRIRDICQIPGERAADILIDSADSMGQVSEKHLVVEMMGKFSNIILTDGEMLIIDCLKRVDILMSEKRQVLPGMRYRVPPPQEKMPFTDKFDSETVLSGLKRAPGHKRADKIILDLFSGISPLMAREIVYRACGTTDVTAEEVLSSYRGEALAGCCEELAGRILKGEFVPFLLEDGDGKPTEFYCVEILQYGGYLTGRRLNSFSELIETYYGKRAAAERIRQRSHALTKSVKNAIDRLRRKLSLQRQEYEATFNRETLRQQGDIIAANYHRIKRGMTILRAENFYDPEGGETEIKLDPSKSPQQNAAKYYKEYSKAKNAEKFLAEQISQGEKELEYLESVLDEIGRAAGERDLGEIRLELQESGYIKGQVKGKKQQKNPPAGKPMEFRSTSGLRIRVGRNNRENDVLTLKDAFKTDMWLHTQKIHGSHVVISSEGREIDEGTIREAAVLAALYSQGKDGANVPVDYTLVKYVKKPSGARPGMVIYTDYRTVYVTPDERLADSLRVK